MLNFLGFLFRKNCNGEAKIRQSIKAYDDTNTIVNTSKKEIPFVNKIVKNETEIAERTRQVMYLFKKQEFIEIFLVFIFPFLNIMLPNNSN